MLKKMVLCELMILATVLMSLPVSPAQTSAAQGPTIKLSSYKDDPFVDESNIGRLDASAFGADEDGEPFLAGNRVSMIDEDFIYKRNATGEFVKFAFNPWPLDGRANSKGNFTYADEARFPIFELERDADGKVVIKDGLQVWKPRDLHLGITTAFAAANAARDAAEFWAGRDIPWGPNNLMEIESHAFVDFNAFYSPTARMIFCGVVPFRLPGETQPRMFETATSRDVIAHESGHGLNDVLKPNANEVDRGYNTWGESFGDQTAMWSSLRDPQRVRDLLAETDGNLYSSNSLTRIGEAQAALTGKGTGIRDAFHNKKISDTPDEVHERSEVLTGAVYKVFTLIYDQLKSAKGISERAAVSEAGDIMGIFLTRATDCTPENRMTLEDFGKAYLKVDKELFGGRYHNLFVDEFLNREIFNSNSVGKWMEHEAAVPSLRLPRHSSDQDVDNLVQANLDRLAIGSEFGLKLQSVTHDRRFGQTIVRVQLTDGRASDAALLDNCGILVFRADRTLADYHSPLPSEKTSGMSAKTRLQARAILSKARQFGLDQRGGLLSIVRKPDGQLTVEVSVMRSEGINCWVEVFTFEHPEGERREMIIPTVPQKLSGVQPNGVRILTADDLNH